MTTLIARRFVRDSTDYRSVVELDDAALVDDELTFAVACAFRSRPNGDWIERAVQGTLNADLEAIDVSLDGRLIARVPLALPLPDSQDFHGNDVDLAHADGAVDEHLDVSAVEEFIGHIPTDPIVGCLVKGAVSTTIGQTIRCWHRTKPRAPVSAR